jgi:hypothetical protein
MLEEIDEQVEQQRRELEGVGSAPGAVGEAVDEKGPNR